MNESITSPPEVRPPGPSLASNGPVTSEVRPRRRTQRIALSDRFDSSFRSNLPLLPFSAPPM